MGDDVRGILLVADDVDLAECLETVLSDAGYRATRAADGDAALREAAATTPSVVLVDYNLPGALTGAALVAALRERLPGGAQVIVMSAERDVVDRAKEC